MSRIDAIPGLAPAGWRPHALHGEASDWPEKNCYADVWIELLHTLGLEPLAMLGFTVAADFEGDQWTFFKPPLGELRALYGVDVQELTVWKPLLDHVKEHLGAGRLVSTEADAFWLPDTAGTDYRRKHTKTTIVISGIDAPARRITYFHNAGCFELEGEDYDRLFRTGEPEDPAYMPFFAELVHIERRRQRSGAELKGIAHSLLKEHFAWRPATNPFTRFAQRTQRDMPDLLGGGLEHFHAWAFASVRQAGAAFELAGAHLRWLGEGDPVLAEAADAFESISHAAKTMILKGARAAHTKKPFDVDALLAPMAQAWDRGMECIGRREAREDRPGVAAQRSST